MLWCVNEAGPDLCCFTSSQNRTTCFLKSLDKETLISYYLSDPNLLSSSTHTHTHIVIFRVTNTQIHPPYVRGTSLMEHFLHSTWWLNTLLAVINAVACACTCVSCCVCVWMCVWMCVCVFSCLSHVAQLNSRNDTPLVSAATNMNFYNLKVVIERVWSNELNITDS